MSDECTAMTGSMWRVRVSPKRPELDAHAAAVRKDIHELGLPHVSRVAASRLYLLEGTSDRAQVEQICAELLADPVTESFEVIPGGDDRSLPGEGFDGVVEVHLKGGVMDPVAASALAAIADLLGTAETDAACLVPSTAAAEERCGPFALSTARLYRIAGVRSVQELEFIARRLLSNDCIEDVYITGFGRHDARPEHLPVAPTRPFKLRHVAIRELDEAGLRTLSREGHLFLSLDEMRTVQNHYRDQGRDPTDLELETIAQTWSEHCVHKTLKSAVRYVGAGFPAGSGAGGGRTPPSPPLVRGGEAQVEVQYENLLKDTIARATHELIRSGRVDWCLSVFEDNAGIIVFDDQYGVAFKVETHNHPSAIEPYGGAATGIGGVIRDVMGCGLGAKPIANTDVFCVGTPDFPMELLPKGVLHPRRVLKGVVAGVRDYGNRMGIPTVNGAVLFDDRYLGNPLVFCGCVGLIPRDRIQKEPKPGDLVVVIGGRTGRDGIHGATFSSAELTDTHADEFSHAVQIGNAITEKQVLDAMMRARDYEGRCLYTATTDCGAGGLSSAVGEMGATLGAVVDLEKVPLKYAGLRYDEIWISEAQERMVVSVPPANWPALKQICDAENVEATAIGTFGNHGRLLIRYDGQTVGDIDTQFLHHGIPKCRKEATWQRAAGFSPRGPSNAENGALPAAWTCVAEPGSAEETLLRRLSNLNTASKEWIFRQYDHEVQGGSVVKPLAGPGEGPSDAAVVRPRLDTPSRAIALSNGICPALADVDPYWAAVAAIDEAIRNAVCVGGDPARTAILDNFCWGNCEDPATLGALVRACQGCHDAALAYGAPFISGKDSLNNEFALDPADAKRLLGRVPLHNNRIRIPSTLLISAMSLIEDVDRCLTMDAKSEAKGGRPTTFFFLGLTAGTWPEANIADAARLHAAVAKLIQDKRLLACHDCGDEGWLAALAEMAFAGQCGVDVSPPAEGPWSDPFAPVPCGYLVQVSDEHIAKVQQAAERVQGVTVAKLASSKGADRLRWVQGGIDMELTALAQAWRSPLAW